ncbi:DUF4192 family protein [Microbacterium sp. P02]|uniref:DUF4192 family protein n=1 Tax=Microbacterium sp. P02 TaxID=3366260 RepID=UPI00366DC58E
MTTIVKAASAAQFLSLVPHLVGCVPRDSLVLVPFAGGRSLGGMRVDLPPEDADVDPLSATYVGLVCRVPDADAIAAVIYTDDPFASAAAGPGSTAAGRGTTTSSSMPRQDLARALLLRADECGLRVTNVLCVAPDGWGSYLDPECPDEGRSLDDLDRSSGIHPELPAPPVGDQRAGALLPAADPAERERVARALISLDDGVRLICGPDRGRPSEPAPPPSARVDPRALATVCALDDLPSLFEDALDAGAGERDPYLVAAMIWCLSRPSLRDIALVQWCGDLSAGDDALQAQLRWEEGEEYPTYLAMHMWGEGGRPDPARLESALDVARRAAATAPRDVRPGPLSACAWLSWALGRSTHAEHYAEEARSIEPEHGLAEIVCSFVQAGHLPDWAFRAPGAR